MEFDGFHQGESRWIVEFLASGEYADCDQRTEAEVDEEGRGVEAARDLAVVESYAWEHHGEGEGLDGPAGHFVRARGEEIAGLKLFRGAELQDFFE